ncbi:Hypp5066 [Branchiostoma lanceolatum]|uniref:Hypp5066 protein n=1 Tax=Branchiostoma lanceolatum TaxID=7740 RepID=A0A8K0AFZ0_BRALA|nr:Hypp5066 [Branchiostoma lanceolatum]
MAAVGRLGSAAIRSFLWRRTALLSSVRCLSKDELPGPYPRTPEEWAAAAKKYGMRAEDYQPYPDDGTGYGDYPMLPEEGVESKDPWVDWDDKWHRRNFGEAETNDCCPPWLPWLQCCHALYWTGVQACCTCGTQAVPIQ